MSREWRAGDVDAASPTVRKSIVTALIKGWHVENIVVVRIVIIRGRKRGRNDIADMVYFFNTIKLI